MLKNKFGKKMLASVMAAAMTVSATAVGLSSITASAAVTGYEELGSGTFNDGVGLPWHICESATGTMKFEVADGCYNVLITNPGGKSNNGEGRWDCQFRHRGLTIEMGHTYRMTYSIWSNKDAKIYTKLGDITDDDKENWHQNGEKLNLSYSDVEGLDDQALVDKLKSASKTGEKVEYWQGWDGWKNSPTVTANQWTTFAWEFKVEQDSDNHCMTSEGTGEWTFHLGGTSDYNDFICCEAGTLLKFDNMALIDMT
ncbi:MAG: carbohydrate binding domain-containing protein, partial [Ruminococcus sp.]